MKILFVLKKYNDLTAQNALCVKGIVKILNNRHKIDVLTLENSGENNNNTCVHQINVNNEFCFYEKIKFAFTFPIHKKVEKLFLKKAEELLKVFKYDVIISVENPIEAVSSITKLKKKFNFKHIIYEIDPASNKYKNPENILEKIWKKRSRRLEKNFYKNADYIYHMESHKKYFSDIFYACFNYKSSYLDIPYIDDSFYFSSINDYTLSKTKLKFIYAGSFYKKIREPYIPFNILNEVLKKTESKIYIYTNKLFLDILKKSYDNNFFVVDDMIPNDILKRRMADSDILVSIGNKNSDFLPSKTIQYISTGKPIIHFVFDENDTSISYYKKYKNALIIDCNNDICKNIENISSFISKKIHGITFSSIKNIYYKNTFEYTAYEIERKINDLQK